MARSPKPRSLAVSSTSRSPICRARSPNAWSPSYQWTRTTSPRCLPVEPIVGDDGSNLRADPRRAVGRSASGRAPGCSAGCGRRARPRVGRWSGRYVGTGTAPPATAVGERGGTSIRPMNRRCTGCLATTSCRSTPIDGRPNSTVAARRRRAEAIVPTRAATTTASRSHAAFVCSVTWRLPAGRRGAEPVLARPQQSVLRERPAGAVAHRDH